jgi:hypothetical protein
LSAPYIFAIEWTQDGGFMTKVTEKEKISGGNSVRGTRKTPNPDEVRSRISSAVGNRAVDLVQGTISEAEKGVFTAMKYLFEMTGLYPAPTQEASPEEGSLAETLLKRLGMLETPTAEHVAPNPNEAGSTDSCVDAVK